MCTIKDRSTVSAALASAWAKSHPREPLEPTHQLPLVQHCEDAGAVAGRLWDAWLPPALRTVLTAHLGDDARAVLQFLAATHDVGKLSPAFACQVGRLADDMHRAGLPFPKMLDQTTARRSAPHNLVSHLVIHRWLVNQGWDSASAHSVAIVSGGHHGRQTSSGSLGAPLPEHLGDHTWAATRYELLDHLAQRYDVSRWLTTRSPLAQSAQVLATAIVVVSDWISSDSLLFPLAPIGSTLHDFERTDDRLESAWRRLDLPGPWQPSTPETSDPTHLLRERFTLPAETSARPVQAAALGAARAMTSPGLMIIEAPTGEGKTEAALLAAEVLAARFGLGGVAVHLPTTATADAMFSRILSWLATLPDDGVESHERSLNLLHSRAHLNATFRDLAPRRMSVSTFDDDEEPPSKPRTGEPPSVRATADTWLRGRHRAALADFSVGTIDQFLFLALRSKFLPLRHLGAARKVVVLDEIHAVDVYMSVYLAMALEWCGAHGVPIIALSATLPTAQRDALHTAYGAGVSSRKVRERARPRRPPRREQPAMPDDTARSEPLTYPVISTTSPSGVALLPVPPSPRRTTTRLELMADDDTAISTLLDQSLVDGGCVLVVRNTVTRAQATFELLRARYGADVHLMHSRFVGPHRSANDDWLRTRFGPDGTQRPVRAIVVATQVAEQSLDVDFDLIVSDLAPVDLLLQRIGRVHRHPRPRPEALREARCVVVGVDDWGALPPHPVRGSEMVYGRHLLLRTAAVLVARTGDAVTAPDDVAELVEDVYGTWPLGPPEWQPAMHLAREADARQTQARKARALSHRIERPQPDGQPIFDWVGVGVSMGSEERSAAKVRDGEDAIEVIAVRRAEGTLRLLEGIDGCDEALPELGEVPDDVALRIAACTVRLPGHLGLGPGADALLDALERAGYVEAWQSHPYLRGRLALVLDEFQQLTLAGLQFSYDARTGLKCEAP